MFTTIKFTLPKNIQNQLMESCYMGNMIARASYILLKKIINPTYSLNNYDIIEASNDFYDNLKKISIHSQASCLCLWSFVICGLVINENDKRQYILYRIKEFGETKKSSSIMSIIKFLETNWKKYSKYGEPWDIILDINGFENVFI